jgi:hypothetical protein
MVLVGGAPRRSTIVTLAGMTVQALLGMVISVAAVLVVMMGLLGVLHVGMLVDDNHHLRDYLRVALKHLGPKLDVV